MRPPAGRIRALLLPALGLGLAGHIAVLGLGWILQYRGEAAARPELSFRIRLIDEAPPVVKRQSALLAKGYMIVLTPGSSERWKSLVIIDRRTGEEQVRVLRRLKRLKYAAPMTVLIGQSAAANPVRIPQLARAVRTYEMEATGYDPGPVDRTRGWVGYTSIGERARFGIVAVDPKVIPYRSALYIEGYGPGLAADTGGAIKGKRVDLCFNTTRQALAWGRRMKKTYVLGGFSAAERKRIRQMVETAD